MCRKTSEDSVRACLQDVPSCALYAVFGIFPKSRYRQTCWVNSIQFQPGGLQKQITEAVKADEEEAKYSIMFDLPPDHANIVG